MVPSSVHNNFPSRASHRGTACHGKNFPSCKECVKNMFCQPISAMVQTPPLTKWHVCLQWRGTLSTSPLSLEMRVLVVPVECVDPLNAPTPFLRPPLQPLCLLEREWEKFLLMPGIQMGLVRAACLQGLQSIFRPTLTLS